MTPTPKTATRVTDFKLGRAIFLGVGLLIAGAALFGLQLYQGQRSRPVMLDQAEALIKEGQAGLALHYLNDHLKRHPNDPAALRRKGELLADSVRTGKDLEEAILVNDQALRFHPQPRGPEGMAIRRRLVELHLRWAAQDPEGGRLHTAHNLVQDLVEQVPNDAGALRLLARVEEALASLGGTENEGMLQKAVKHHEAARALDPGNAEGAERLAHLYVGRLDRPVEAQRVMDRLVEVNPTAPAYLARARFFAAISLPESRVSLPGAKEQAEAAMRRAVELAPENFEVRLTAAEEALRLGRNAEARDHLKQIPKERQADTRVRYLLGLTSLNDNEAEQALAVWRQSLHATGGGDIELTWRMAFVLLQLGRVAEAEPLMAQFRRLSGGDRPNPAYLYLDGLRLLKQNRPAQAIERLERALKSENPLVENQVYFSLGQAYEAVRDEARALDAYAKAVKAAPRWPMPRLARIRLLQPRQPKVATAELERALAEIPNDSGLLIARARDELKRQAERSPRQRSWTELEALVERTKKLAPGSAALAMVETEYLTLVGRNAEAAAQLEQVLRHHKTNAEIWVAQSRKLVLAGRPEEALAVLDRATAPEHCGDQAPIRIERARVLTQMGHGQEAREMLVRDLDRVPAEQRPQIWMKLGDLYTNQADRAQARRAYAEWARLLPDDPVPRLFLLELAVADGDDKAVAQGIDDLRGIGGGQNLHYRVAQALDLIRPRKGETTKERDVRLARAKEQVDAIRADAPTQRYAYMLDGQIYERRGQLEKAVESYERALEFEGGPLVLQRLVVLYTKLKRPDEVNRINRAHGEQTPGMLRYQAAIAGQLGDKEQARKLAEAAAAADPDNIEGQLWQAQFLAAQMKEPQAAENALLALVGKHPEEPGPWVALISLQVGRRQHERARATIERMRQAMPKVDRPEFFLAQCQRLAGDLTGAQQSFEAALEKRPDDPRIVRGLAEFYEKIGRHDRAQKTLEDALRRDPSQRWASRALALLLSSYSKDPRAWAKAWDYIGVGAAGDTPEDRLARAIVLGRGGKPEQHQQAIEILRQLVDDLPAGLSTSLAARHLLARLYVAGGRGQDAAAILQPAAEALGARPEVIVVYAEALVVAKRYDEAAKQIDRLDGLAPDDLTAPKLRAAMLQAQGKSAAEIAGPLEKAFQDRRDGPHGEAVGRQVVDALLILRARAAAEQVALAMKQKWPQTASVLAKVRASQGRGGEAMELLQDAAATGDPASLREAAQNAAFLAVSTRVKDPARLADAEAILKAALKTQPDSIDLMTKLGYIYHYQERYADEYKLYLDIERIAERVAPRDFQFLNNMAWTLSEGLNRPAEALVKIEEAIRRSGVQLPQLLDTRGVILTRLGKHDEAIRSLEEAIKADPASAAAWAHLARAYHRAGRPADFRKARDSAKKAGLTPEALDPTDRKDLEKLLFAATE